MEFILDKIIIEGGNTRLEGEVIIEGAKNAVLPLLAATILPKEGKTILTNVPILSDVYTMNNVVRGLDIQVDFDEAKNTIEVDASGDILDVAPYEYVSKMRASIVVLGPILARKGHAKVSMPGGCTIGSRPLTFTSKVWRLWVQKSHNPVGILQQQLMENLKEQQSIWISHQLVRHKT